MLTELEKRQYGLGDLLRIPFQCNPGATIFLGLQYVLAGLIPTLQVLVTARFIDGALQIYQGTMDLQEIYPVILALLGLIAYRWVLFSVVGFANTRLRMGIQARFRTAVTEKRAHLAYHQIENPKTWDLIARVAGGAEDQIITGLTNLLDIVSNVIRITGLLLILFQQVWWAALVILVFSIPLFSLGIKSGRASYEVNREVSKYQRRYQYLGNVLLGREAVEERALFGYSNQLNETWHERHEEARLKEYEAGKKWFIRMKMGSSVTALTSVVVVGILLHPVLTGVISIGMFIALVNATFGLVDLMSWQFVNSMDQLARSKEYMRDLTDFVALEESYDAQSLPVTPPPVFESLEFRKVSFCYPGTENLILDEISFQIEPGGHYSFVGVNGAGKTTITKLITGLYDNYSGEILLNGRNLRSYSQGELKAFFNVVYQDFARYHISLRENIALGDQNRGAGVVNGFSVKEAASELDLADVIAKLPQGLNTPLGKIKEGGQDLSGGEWQRVAMARAVYNPAPFRILDEPTAALDPLSESRLYGQFERISQDKTTILISHRLGSTKLADLIFVIDQGRIAEQGSHEELMAHSGIYAEMYESQRGWYS